MLYLEVLEKNIDMQLAFLKNFKFFKFRFKVKKFSLRCKCLICVLQNYLRTCSIKIFNKLKISLYIFFLNPHNC